MLKRIIPNCPAGRCAVLPTGNSAAFVVLTVSAAPVTCVELPILTVLELELTYNTLAAVPLTAKSTAPNAELIFTRPFLPVMLSPLATMLPPCNSPEVYILPPSMLPVAYTRLAELILAPSMLPSTVKTLPAVGLYVNPLSAAN